MLADHNPHPIELPTYPFQRTRYWLEDDGTEAGPQQAGRSAGETEFWETVERADVARLAATLGMAENDSALSRVFPALSAWRRRQDELATLDDRRYRIVWQPLSPAPGSALSGAWSLVAPRTDAVDPWTDWAEDALRRRGAEVTRLPVDAAAADRADLAERLRDLPGPVISLLPLDETPHLRHPRLPSGVAATLALIQAMADVDAAGPLWTVTRGAVRTGTDDPAPRPQQAQVWGLGRSVALEQPARWGGLIDLPGAPGGAAADHLAAVLAAADGEDQIAVRPAGPLARRLVRAPLEATADARPWHTRGTVLITGGTGGLGSQAARWLAARGAPHLVLTSRRGRAAPGAVALEAELTALGAAVTFAACDVRVRAELAAVIAAIPEDRPLSALVHAAGVAQRFTPVTELDLDAYTDVISGKVAGAVHLDELLGDARLDAFVLFSSSSGIWGSGENAAYAAGNAFLDQLAEARRTRGLTATSIAWGAWGGEGMRTIEGVGDYLDRRGVLQMDPESCLAAMATAVERDETSIAVAAIDWARFVPGFTSARPSPLLGDIPDVRRTLDIAGADPATADGSARAELVRRLAELAVDERAAVLLDLVRTEIATVLRHPSTDAIAADRAVNELGFDSLTAVELRNSLNARTGLRLPVSLVFDHPTPRAMADHLLVELGAAPGPGSLADALAAVERGVAAFEAGSPEAERIADLLDALAKRIRSEFGAGRPPEADVAMESATAEEMFALIDRELSGSPTIPGKL
jgi:polyketide synthase 12